MQTDSAVGPSVPAGVHTAEPRPFTWRDLVTSLVILPAVILAIVAALIYARVDTPKNAEISLSEYRFILKLARTQPSLRPAIARAIKDGKIDQKEFDAILDKLDIRPGPSRVRPPGRGSSKSDTPSPACCPTGRPLTIPLIERLLWS